MEITFRAVLCVAISTLLWLGQCLVSVLKQARKWLFQKELKAAEEIIDANDLFPLPRGVAHWAEYINKDMRYVVQKGNRHRPWMQRFRMWCERTISTGWKFARAVAISPFLPACNPDAVRKDSLPLFQSPFPEYGTPPPMPDLVLPPSIADDGYIDNHMLENGRWAWELRKQPKPWALNDPSTHWDYSPQPKVLILSVSARNV